MKNNIVEVLLTIFSIIILSVIAMLIWFTVYSDIQTVKIKYNSPCKEMENWSIDDLPARCVDKLHESKELK